MPLNIYVIAPLQPTPRPSATAVESYIGSAASKMMARDAVKMATVVPQPAGLMDSCAGYAQDVSGDRGRGDETAASVLDPPLLVVQFVGLQEDLVESAVVQTSDLLAASVARVRNWG